MSLEKKYKIEVTSSKDRAVLRKMAIIFFGFRLLTGRMHFALYLLPLLVFLLLLHRYITTRYQHLVPALLQSLQPALFTFVAVLIITPVVIKIARNFNILEKPTFPKQHKVPIPHFGGIAIYLSFFIIALFHQPWTPQMKSILMGGAIMLVLGVMDDIRPLSSVLRLGGQVVASGIVIASGIAVSFTPDTAWGNILAIGLTLLWILGIINATNFIDGVDGLAAGLAAISSAFFFIIALHLEQYDVVLIASLLMGCGLGFLIFNFKPAKIILGDGGSTFMGFVLACIALYGGWSSWGAIIAIGVPVLISGVVIFDIIYISISRIKNGQVRNFREFLDYRGRDHFHHRLINLGFKEEEAVVFIYITSIVLGLSALVIEHARVSYPVVILLIQAALIFVIITLLMLAGRQRT